MFDKVDYHESDAIAHGQPIEHAFTHIGFFLAWLVRRKLTDDDVIPTHMATALAEGLLRPNDLADLVDGALGSFAMTDEGEAFAAACYSQYLEDYEEEFSDTEAYGVSDDPSNEARAAAILDRAYAAWVASGRPPPPTIPSDDSPPIAVRHRIEVETPGGSEHPDKLAALGFDVVPWHPRSKAHVSPELERLIRDCAGREMDTDSTSARDYGSALLNRAIKRMDRRPEDVIVAVGIGGSPDVPTADIYSVPGIPADRLEVEFELVIANRPREGWPRRIVDGGEMRFALVDLDLPHKVALAWFATAGHVAFVSSASEDDALRVAVCLRRAIEQLA